VEWGVFKKRGSHFEWDHRFQWNRVNGLSFFLGGGGLEEGGH